MLEGKRVSTVVQSKAVGGEIQVVQLYYSQQNSKGLVARGVQIWVCSS